jgi:hypothetical protein
MMAFGGSGRERSGGRGASAFQPEMKERDGGKGDRYGAVAKRVGDPAAWARGAWWSCGGGEGGVRRPARTRHRRRRVARVVREQGKEKARLAGGPARRVGSNWRWEGRV